MTCPDLPHEDLIAYLDGELAAEDAVRVRTHLEAHSECRAEADALEQSAALLARLPGLEPSPDFVARTLAKARSGDGRLHRLPLLRWAAAAAIVAAAGGWWLTRDAATPTAPDGAPGGDPEPQIALTASDERAIARDLLVLTNLELLESSEAAELLELVDDLDVLDSLISTDEDGG